MKKLFWASVALMMSLVACDEIKQDTPDEPLTPDQQKEKMEEISSELMTEFAAREFEDVMKTVSDLYLSCESTFDTEDYDWSALERVFEERVDKMFSFEEIDEYTSTYTYMFLLSQITGQVTFGEKAVSYKDADNTSASYTDDNGIEWYAEITPVGKVQEVYLGEFEDSWWNGYYDYETGTWHEEMYTDYMNITVSVPEKLNVLLKKDGKDYVTVTYTFDVAISDGGVNIKKDRVSVTETLSFNGMELVLDKASYNASTGNLEASATLTKDGKLIFSESLSAEGNVDLEKEDFTAKNINVNVNLIDRMQIKGSCPDAKSLAEIFMNSEPQAEKDWERIVNNANTKFNLNVYFDGGNTVQAVINLEPRWDSGEWGNDYWCEPAIEFNDGSRYLFYEYFTEDSFKDVINDAESFVEKYETLLERYFGFIY